MKVQLREIPCHKAFALSPTFVGKVIGGLPIREALEAPADDPEVGAAQAELDFYLEGANIFARGDLRGYLTVACGRCLGPARVAINEDLAVTFLPRSELPEDKEETELEAGEEVAGFEEDDVDVYPYDEDAVDLEPLFREQLILAVPYAPLCKEDCKGLCTVCGIDLNRETCSCDRRVVDPRLASLKDLKV